MDESNLDDDATLHRLLTESLEAIERGESIDRDQLYRDHPEHADAMCDFLDNNSLVRGVVSELRNFEVQSPVDSAFDPTLDSQRADGQRRDEYRVGRGDRLTYIGEYEVVSEIARGGMGIVFKARQTKLRRTVALKMILAGRLASETDVDRFHREARSAAALHHPNIVGVYEVGTHEGHHYFTMDFVESQSLASIISGESLAPRRTAKLLAKISDAIHYAHGQGVLHRDLKPANVLIDEAGEPHVTDFGLAKTLADDVSGAELTSTGQILGTPGYMSPEQASAKHDLVSVASDVYSLGAVLYACLCGRAPFVADSAIDTIRQVIEKEPVSLRLLNPGVPKDLETICLKCLQKEPHRRYGTAGEMADDLRRFFDGRPVLARPIARATRAWRWAKRNPWVASLATLSVALLLTGTAVSSYFAYEAEQRAIAEKLEHDRADRETAAATLAKKTTESALAREAAARGDAESARDAEATARREAEKALANEQAARRLILQREREAKWNEYVARLTVIQQPWQDREYGHLTRMVDQLRPGEGEPDFRGWEWSYYADLVQQGSRRIPDVEELKRGCWSPDGQRFATAGKRLQIFDAQSMQPIINKDLKNWLRNVVFDPEGTAVAIGFSDGYIGLFQIERQQMIRRWKAHERGSDYLSFSPDGRHLVSGSLDGSSAIWEVATGDLVHQLTPARKNIYLRNVDWHPSEPLVVIADRTGYVRVFDADTGRPSFSLRACGISCDIGLWSPDGKTLAGGGSFPNYEIRLYSADGVHQGELKSEASCGAWSPDGKLFATGSQDQNVTIRDVDSGQIVQTAHFHSAPIHFIDWSPDGKRILSIDSTGHGRVWKVSPNIPDAVVIHQDALDVRTVRYSSDGRWIAGACIDGYIRIWNAANGELDETSEKLSATVKDVSWSDDARRLVGICDDNKVWLWDRVSGEIRQPFDTGLRAGGVHVWVDWRPGTNQIACGEYADDTHLFDVETGERMATTSLKGGFARWSRSGDRLALVDHLMDPSLQLVKPIGVSAQLVSRTAWAPNGRLIASALADGRLAVSDLLADAKPHFARGHRHFVSAVAWHPSGTRIATGDHDGALKLWDAATLDEVWSTKLPHRVLSLDWSPDGEQLVSSDGVDVNSYPTRKKEGDIYSVRIWGTRHLKLIDNGPEMLPTMLARALAPGNDRRAAETVLRLGGGLSVATHDEKLTIDRLEHLPPSDFQLLAIDLSGIVAVNDETLSRLHSLDSIQQLNLRLTEVSDDAVRSMLQSIAGINLVDVDASHREFHIDQDGSVKPILTPDEELARLTAAIAADPKDGDLLVSRARWHAKHLRWNDALADLESYLQRYPLSGWLRCEAAAAALMSGNTTAYRHHLMTNLNKLPDWDFAREAGTGAYLAEMAAAAPDSIEDFSVLLPLATRHKQINLGMPYEAVSLGMVEHRLGNHRRVLEILDPHRQRGGHHYGELILVAALRSSALHRLGRHDEADAALRLAERVAEQAWPVPEPGQVPTYGNLKSFVMATKLLEETRRTLNRPE